MLDNQLVMIEVYHLKNVLLKTYVDADDNEEVVVVMMKNYQDWLYLKMKTMSKDYMEENPDMDYSMESNGLETFRCA